jgi:ribosomal-protein-alanine N-acetyltransferase
MSGIEIRRATAVDLDAIEEIQNESPEASAWLPVSYLVHDCSVAIVDNRVAGFLVSRSISSDEREILNVAVRPAYRRGGVGRALVEADLTRNRGSCFLEVRESNQVAINLYKAMGFEVVGRRADYYDHPPEAAIVMRFFS